MNLVSTTAIRLRYIVKVMMFIIGNLGIIIQVQAQNENVLSGVVIDAATRKPMPFVNVFFENTTIGSITDSAGKYVIKNFADGKYSVITSFIGYRKDQKFIEFNLEKKILNIFLSEGETKLKEVQVIASQKGQHNNLKLFKLAFLGSTHNAEKCKILNPKDLYLFNDVGIKDLVGHSKKDLIIENYALGYRLTYSLDWFEWNFNSNTQFYAGTPRFEELEPKDNKQLKQWTNNRRRSYNGSFIHFIRCLQKGNVNGPFKIRKLYKIPNPIRPFDSTLNRLIVKLKKALKTAKEPLYTKLYDSLSQCKYLYHSSMPMLIDSLGPLITDPDVLVDKARKIIFYKGLLDITYNEWEEYNYSANQKRAPSSVQHSIINLLGDKLYIYQNGYYEDIRNVFMEGYMGWTEKISELIPLNYQSESSPVLLTQPDSTSTKQVEYVFQQHGFEKEEYYVLKEDNKIKQGSYFKYRGSPSTPEHFGILEMGNYDNNKKEGLWEYYFKGIQVNHLKAKGVYKNGMRSGAWLNYYKDDSKKEIAKTDSVGKGQKSAILTFDNINLKLRQRGEYEEGTKMGIWETFDIDGHLTQQYDYTADELIMDSSIKRQDSLNIARPLLYDGGDANLIVDLNESLDLKKNVTSAMQDSAYIVVEINVNELGKVADQNIILRKNSKQVLEDEVMTAIKSTDGHWLPALRNGRKISARYQLKFDFHRDRNNVMNYLVTHVNSIANF